MSAAPVRTSKVHRFEVVPKPGQADPIGEAVRRDATALGVPATAVRAAHVYLVKADLSPAQAEAVRTQLLADPVTESAITGASPVEAGSAVVEVHPLPGVMDPVAQSVEAAIGDLVGAQAQVSTGWRYDLKGVSPEIAESLAKRLLANPVIQRVETKPWHPSDFPHAAAHEQAVRSIPILKLSDEQLVKLSRAAHLFLSLDEMRAIQAEYRRVGAGGRDPTDIELETLAQTWSEHCVHKTMKSTIRYSPSLTEGAGERAALGEADPIDWSNRPGHTQNPDGSVTINNLLKSTVAAATHELIKDGVDWTLSVFTDNSGIIALDDKHGVCIKVETHNHPSAIEPYGGAATGAGGCIRDVIGTGLGARPIANTDVFAVGFPDIEKVPAGCLHPRRVLTQVVAGVRDYGNRMGIPTVNGAVYFDNRYVGNPLVYCGCVGIIPRHLVKGAAKPGDRIIALGGRTGRDGIHGATFSSAELTDTHADEFSHAVQIGNAITEKQLLDAIMRARDFTDESGRTAPLYHAMTDCGAGGFSSAVGEMGSKLGAQVHLERAPLKYPGLSYTEIWISEAQERMVLAVPPENVETLMRIGREEGVEIADLGHFGTPLHDLVLNYHGNEVGRLSMHFLHEGIPMPTRQAVWKGSAEPAKLHGGKATATGSGTSPVAGRPGDTHSATLPLLLSHPNIASKHWIIRQYDHEVRGNTVVKPLVGPAGRGPSDASVLEPVAGSGRGIAIASGLQTPLGDPTLGGDPYLMALAAIDEAVRNLVCVGADPSRIAILDNFCWPSCNDPQNLGALVRAAEGCYDGAKAYRTPFVSGKDSLNNQFTTEDGITIQIPPTLLITGLGIVPRIDRSITSDAKEPGNALFVVGATGTEMGGSHYQQLVSKDKPGMSPANPRIPTTDLEAGPATARAVASLISKGLVRSAHDCSEGGLAVALAEMLIGGSTTQRPLGAEINLGTLPWKSNTAGELASALFAETPSRYVLEVRPENAAAVAEGLRGVPHAPIGRVTSTGKLDIPLAGLSHSVEDLAKAWRGTLDW